MGCHDEALFARLVDELGSGLEEVDELIDECEEPEESSIPMARLELEALQTRLYSLKDRMLKGENVDAELEELASPEAWKAAKPSNSPLPDAKTILRHIVMGEPVDGRVSLAYDAVFRLLSLARGAKLPNENWVDVKHIENWAKKLDRSLATQGVPQEMFSVSDHLLARGNPFLDTVLSDMGYLRHQEIVQIVPVLDTLKLKDKGPEDPETYILDIRNWLSKCLEEDEDLICFTG